MIRIRFEEPGTAIWKRWVKQCEDAAAILKAGYGAGKEVVVSDLYRRKSVKQEVYFSKAGPFRGRCAYCESYIADFQHGDIEHFRPKKAVTDENDVPITISGPGGKPEQHPGYFWLAYNWRNLLPSCVTCNQPGDEGIGKRNRFPLDLPPTHGMPNTDVAEERPLLINPIDPDDDDPEHHLGIEVETGVMCAKNNSKRGDMCIKIFGLNIRDQLVSARKSAITETIAKCIELLMADDARAPILKKELNEMEQGSFSYTLARRAALKRAGERIGKQ